MLTKEYLLEYRSLVDYRNRQKEKLDELNERIKDYKKIRLDDIHVQTSKNKSDLSDLMVQKEDYERRVDRMDQIINKRFPKINKELNNLPEGKQKDLFTAYYLEANTMAIAADKICYSESRAYQLNKEVLKRICERL